MLGNKNQGELAIARLTALHGLPRGFSRPRFTELVPGFEFAIVAGQPAQPELVNVPRHQPKSPAQLIPANNGDPPRRRHDQIADGPRSGSSAKAPG